jgi:hypothetical protein
VTDRRVRELERRFRETHSVEDEAAWLRELIRIGELSDDGVELLVYVNQPAALLVRDLAPDCRRVGIEDTAEWLKGLNLWGKEASLRAAIAIGRIICGGERSGAARALAFAERRLADPEAEVDEYLQDTTPHGTLAWYLLYTALAKGTFTAGLAVMGLADVAPLGAEALANAVAQALAAWVLEPASRITADRWAEDQRRESAARVENLTKRADALRRRLELGTLSLARLELAAHLGHWPACRALDRPLKGDSDRWVRKWVYDIADYGDEPLLLAARALNDVPGYLEPNTDTDTRTWARKRVRQLDPTIVSAGDVRRAVRHAVLPWALGTD